MAYRHPICSASLCILEGAHSDHTEFSKFCARCLQWKVSRAFRDAAHAKVLFAICMPLKSLQRVSHAHLQCILNRIFSCACDSIGVREKQICAKLLWTGIKTPHIGWGGKKQPIFGFLKATVLWKQKGEGANLLQQYGELPTFQRGL